MEEMLLRDTKSLWNVSATWKVSSN